MAVSDSELASLLARVARDIGWTISPRKQKYAREWVDVREQYEWRFDEGEAIDAFTDKYVEDVRQAYMDTFVDTRCRYRATLRFSFSPIPVSKLTNAIRRLCRTAIDIG